MKTQLLFIQGVGKNAHAEDKKLADNLKSLLGTSYEIHFPKMKNEETGDYRIWVQQITRELDSLEGNVILVGHSIGASVLLKLLSEEEVENITALFLISTPFWGGDKGWKYDGFETLQLPSKTKSKLPANLPLFFYHASDDEVVPFNHLSLFAKEFPKATIRKIEKGGHQLNNDLSEVAKDIALLTP